MSTRARKDQGATSWKVRHPHHAQVSANSQPQVHYFLCSLLLSTIPQAHAHRLVGFHGDRSPGHCRGVSLLKRYVAQAAMPALTLMMWAKYFPETRLSVLMKISRRIDSPMGLYLALNLSKR